MEQFSLQHGGLFYSTQIRIVNESGSSMFLSPRLPFGVQTTACNSLLSLLMFLLLLLMHYSTFLSFNLLAQKV